MMKPQRQIIGECKEVDISKLDVSPFNTRVQGEESETSEKFQELRQSIKSNGLIEPVIVRPAAGKYEVVAGTRRLAALKSIGAVQVPTMVRNMTDNEVRIISVVENIHRNDLTEDEKEQTLIDIYLATWNQLLNEKDLKDRPFNTDDDKIALARSYLIRIRDEDRGLHPEKTGSLVSDKRKGGVERTVYPTEKFREIAQRVGYKVDRQYNILRGYGAFSTNKNYADELPPTYKAIAEETARILKLEEAEKQKLAQVIKHKQMKIDREKKARTKKERQRRHKTTEKEQVQDRVNKFVKDVMKKREEEKTKQRQASAPKPAETKGQEEDPIKQQRKARSAALEQIEIEQSKTRAREDIAELGTELFKLLTGQELNT